MIFNGIDLSPYFRVNEIRGRRILSNEITLTDSITEGGSRFLNKTRPPRTLEVDVTIIAEDSRSLGETITELNGILAVSRPVPIVFPDEPSYTYYGIPEVSNESGEFSYFHQGGLQIICPNPDKIGKSRSIELSTSKVEHIIHGQIDTPWTSRTVFTVPQSSYRLEGSNGLLILLNYDFIAGDVLEVDYTKRKVTLNGEDLSVSVSLSTNWRKLPVGKVSLKSSHKSVITYDERYF